MSDNSEQTLEELYKTVINESVGTIDDFNNSVNANSTVLNNNNKDNSEDIIMASVKPPKPLVVNSDLDMAQEWTEWIELYDHYYHATELSKKPEQTQASTLIAVLGRSGLKILNNLGLTAEEKKTADTIKTKLTDHFAPSRNKTYERCQFHRIK